MKPVLLGQGLNVPMIGIFMGAMTGLFMSGIIGSVVGAVLLAIGYKMLHAWIRMNRAEPQRARESGLADFKSEALPQKAREPLSIVLSNPNCALLPSAI
ncbi:MAG: hypothetical protein NPIRA06_10370 [Nitrospirales bacterium]|nr:MAG: hypothetical protein NPIRA06_10370 [Nitrospirales bacterium]